LVCLRFKAFYFDRKKTNKLLPSSEKAKDIFAFGAQQASGQAAQLVLVKRDRYSPPAQYPDWFHGAYRPPPSAHLEAVTSEMKQPFISI